MPAFAIGDAVLRREDCPERRATVLAIEIVGDDIYYQIAYAEGGDGWWPEVTLEAAEPQGD